MFCTVTIKVQRLWQATQKYHSQTKHIELDLHFVREHIAKKELVVEHVSSSSQLADVLTKLLGFDHFAYMRDKLNVCLRP